MARIEWVEHRLQNWARWRLMGGSGALGYAAVNLGAALNGGRAGYVTSVIPVSDVDAAEVDDAVERLPGHLKITVIEVYTGEGGLAAKLQRLACAESTMHRRIGDAHRLLADHFLAKDDKQRAERARVELLQAKARP